MRAPVCANITRDTIIAMHKRIKVFTLNWFDTTENKNRSGRMHGYLYEGTGQVSTGGHNDQACLTCGRRYQIRKTQSKMYRGSPLCKGGALLWYTGVCCCGATAISRKEGIATYSSANNLAGPVTLPDAMCESFTLTYRNFVLQQSSFSFFIPHFFSARLAKENVVDASLLQQ